MISPECTANAERVSAPARVPPHVFFLVSAVFHYLGPSIAVLLFAYVTPPGMAWLRIASAGLVFAVWRRPWRLIGGLSQADRGLLLAFGVALAAMNIVFYEAIARLPLATVGAIEFLGPISVAAAGVRTLRNGAALVLTVAGVGVLTDVRIADRPARLCFRFRQLRAVRPLHPDRPSRRFGANGIAGIDGLASAMLVASLVALPFGFRRGAARPCQPAVDGRRDRRGHLVLGHPLCLRSARHAPAAAVDLCPAAGTFAGYGDRIGPSGASPGAHSSGTARDLAGYRGRRGAPRLNATLGNRTMTGQSIKLGIVRGISYGLFGPPDTFVPQVRVLGGRSVRVYLYWGQIEPEPGRFDWRTVDALLAQLDGSEEVWVTVCSSSQWATRTANDLPAAVAGQGPGGLCTLRQCAREPLRRPRALLAVQQRAQQCRPAVVGKCRGLCRAAGVFSSRAVRDADPQAKIVLGGCGYDVLSSPDDGPARAFFDHLVQHGRDAFDLFSVHLYDDPLRIPAHIELVRAMMRRHGYEKPVVVGEYNGPTLFEFPEARSAPPADCRRRVRSERQRLRCGRPDRSSRDPGPARHARALRPYGNAAATDADVHGWMLRRTRGETAPDQLPRDRRAQPAGPLDRRDANRVLEPWPRGSRTTTIPLI